MHYLKEKYYLINKFDSKNINRLIKDTIVIYRNYTLDKEDEKTILKIKVFCKKRNIKFYLSNNVKLAIKLNLDGAYIPSFNKKLDHLSYSFKKNFKIVGSAHNLMEMRTKELQGVKRIFLSSLFKKNNNYLGLNKFKSFSNLTKKKIIVLGGVSKKNLNKIKLISCEGFAGISFFE